MNEEYLQEEKIKAQSHLPLFVLVILVGLISGVIGSALVYSFVLRDQVTALSQEPQTIVNHVTQLQDDATIDVVKETTPVVVSIIATKDTPQYQRSLNSPFNLFFNTPQQQVPQQEQVFEKKKVGGGTGFFVSSDGIIVTNRHVVADSNAEYTVMTSDGAEHSAKILARDQTLDFAVLKVEGEEFSIANLGNSDQIEIGQTVIAIGNSLGEFSHSVSRGIISGVQRNIVAGTGIGSSERLRGIIQTDAAINFGNSGGPLIDLEGHIIGINTAVAQGAENIGFAIPINQVMRLIDDVKISGTISQPFLGIRYVILTPEIASELKVPYDEGIVVARGQKITDFAVLPNSPADKAGIMEYDVILEVDGEKMTAQKPLSYFLSQHRVGDTVNLKVWRKGQEEDIAVTLENKEM